MLKTTPPRAAGALRGRSPPHGPRADPHPQHRCGTARRTAPHRRSLGATSGKRDLGHLDEMLSSELRVAARCPGRVRREPPGWADSYFSQRAENSDR